MQLASIGGTSRFASWLRARSTAGRLAHLRVSSHKFPLRRSADAMWASRRLVRAVARAPAASALESLALTVAGDIGKELACWAGRLPRLRSLTLTGHVPLHLPACLGCGLWGLRELRIFEDTNAEPLLWASSQQPPATGILLEVGSLPRSLRRLEVAACGFTVLPAAIAAATQLTELQLCNSGQPMSLAGLAGLTNLRALALRDFAPAQQLLAQLAGLPLLERLDLSAAAERGPQAQQAQQAALAAIARLGRLQQLCLGQWGLQRLPEALLYGAALPSSSGLQASYGRPAVR